MAELAAEDKWHILKDIGTSWTACPREIKYELSEIGHFSINTKDEFVPNNSEMRYYVNPEKWVKMNLNLTDGIETFRRLDIRQNRNRMDQLLQWILLDPNR